MSEVLYRQYVLTRPGDAEGTVHRLVSWLPEKKGDAEIKKGTRLTLEAEPDIYWTVESRSDDTRTKEEVRSFHSQLKNFGASLPEKSKTS